MEPLGRRKFAKGLGLLGLFSIAAVGYKEATSLPTVVYKQDEIPTKELEAQLEGKPSIQMMATYGTPKPKPAYGVYNVNNYYVMGYGDDYVEGTRKDVKVTMVPGPDGKLYVKENDTWRKI